MQFKLSNLIGLLAVAGTALSLDVATSLDGYSALAHDIGLTAKSIELLNGFQTGQELVDGYHSLVKSENKGYSQAQDAQALSTDQQQAACNSFVTYASVLTDTLKITIGKHGVLEAVGIAYPIAAVLRGLEGTTDTIAYTLIADLAPSCGDSLKDTKSSLDKVMTKAINTFADGLA
ncbi:uncharacterized protein N7503_007090 [Penicillium pulvis]|uniref:uncharacterized protein n=1 Tax=Penicillium pulvis TaxID=1562058 RepID=UPI0025467E7F|nr:uncharacterized protein N7503_007090 [Penicillium pulvis]KAJ5797794.1 hypothetical protein N7503_007090 [Penicillium pulvis]